ncbi:MAG: methionine adenosyltransferase [bacterium]|nr:methionine adenosyltransferase [bacterium]
MDSGVRIEALTAAPVARRTVEIVERKGLGHPDTICDRVAEAVSHELCRVYLELAGRVLHHNVDKALLVAGSSEPRLGGGRVLRPMRLLLGDRATNVWEGKAIPVAEIAESRAARWFEEHLRFVDPAQHLRIESVLRPGSAQLVDVAERRAAGANDTSVGVGYAPLTETERLVLTTEAILNGPDFKGQFPAAGEDVKVMGARIERRVELTVAVAFVDRFVKSERDYFDCKAAMREQLLQLLGAAQPQVDELDLVINALDREGHGAEGLYLTVLGTSADGADSGEVGRGNRVNGLIAFHRPASLEAAAGKNPVSHVGKIYNLLAQRIADQIQADVAGIEETRVFLCSRIGRPIDRPWVASAQLSLAPGVAIGDVASDVRAIYARELAGVPRFLERLVREEVPVC